MFEAFCGSYSCCRAFWVLSLRPDSDLKACRATDHAIPGPSSSFEQPSEWVYEFKASVCPRLGSC